MVAVRRRAGVAASTALVGALTHRGESDSGLPGPVDGRPVVRDLDDQVVPVASLCSRTANRVAVECRAVLVRASVAPRMPRGPAGWGMRRAAARAGAAALRDCQAAGPPSKLGFEVSIGSPSRW